MYVRIFTYTLMFTFIPQHQPPPQAYSGRKADVWAVGVAFYFLTHGRLPFPDSNETAIIENVVNGNEGGSIGSGWAGSSSEIGDNANRQSLVLIVFLPLIPLGIQTLPASRPSGVRGSLRRFFRVFWSRTPTSGSRLAGHWSS